MSHKISFGLEKNNLQNNISGIRLLKLTMQNKFFTVSIVNADKDELARNKSHINVECVAAASEDTLLLQNLAMKSTPIYCRVSSKKLGAVYGKFVVSHFAFEEPHDHLAEVSFKLKSSGDYELR